MNYFLRMCVLALAFSILGCDYLSMLQNPRVEIQPHELPLGPSSSVEQIRNISISPDRSLFLVVDSDWQFQIFSRQSRQKLRTLQKNKIIFLHYFTLVFSRDSRTIAGANDDSQIFLWDTVSGEIRLVLTGHKKEISDIVFSSDNKSIATASYDKTIKIWDTATGQLQRTFNADHAFFEVAFSQDGKIVNAADVFGTVYQWNLLTNKLIRRLTNLENKLQSEPTTVDDFVYAVAFSPDGKLMARRDFDKEIRLWNLETGRLVNVIKRNNELSYTMTFSPDSQILATVDESKQHELLTGGNYHVLRLWNTKTGSLIAQSNERQYVTGLAFDPNGEEIITTGTLLGKVLRWKVVFSSRR